MPLALARVQHAIVDMDGVLYHGNEPIRGGGEFLDYLREIHVGFLLLTNNSTLTVSQYVAKLEQMGINATDQEILTSAVATAAYLGRVAAPGSRVFVIGEEGLRSELRKTGLLLTDEAESAFVVVGFDRQLTYAKLSTATRAIDRGAKFIGSNPDRTFPSETGLAPGAGATLAALEAATGVAPLVIGKPERAILDQALQRLQASPQTTVAIGDGLYTDVIGGQRAGLMTVLLMSGVTSAGQLEGASQQPDAVYADVAALHEAWRKAVGQSGIGATE